MDFDLLDSEEVVTECGYAPRFLLQYKIVVWVLVVLTVLMFLLGVICGGISSGIEFAFVFALFSAFEIYAYHAQQQTKLVLTNKRLLGVKGIVKKEMLDVPLDKIDNVSVKHGLSDKIGEITIHSNSGVFIMQKFDRPVIMRLAILEQISIYKQEQAEMHAQAIANAMKNA